MSFSPRGRHTSRGSCPPSGLQPVPAYWHAGLRFEKRFGPTAMIEHTLDYSGMPAVHVAASWKGGHVKFYMSGSLIGKVPLS